jgi:flagellar basal-body rod modification protein FlgD
MQVSPVAATPGVAQPAANAATSDAASSAFGLSFDALLRIVLTQLTYQDPLKPMDNFEFVSQLAQFSQIQIGQTGNDRLGQLVTAQGSSQAAGLLGKMVDVPAGSATLSGRVTAISFASGEPRLTITTGNNQTISDIALSAVSQIREGD